MLAMISRMVSAPCRSEIIRIAPAALALDAQEQGRKGSERLV
jgi:hypothetical protein